MIRLALSALVLTFGVNALATDSAPAAPAQKPAGKQAAQKPSTGTAVAGKTKEDCMKLKGTEQTECMKHVDGHQTK